MPHSSYLTDVLIILLAAALVVPLFQRLKSSPVLGYLVAGMLIGPHGLAIITDFTETAVLASFGVVFLLFTIGLELSLERLRVMRHTVFGLGTAQMVVTGTVVALLARALGVGSEAALVLACGLALSSTAVVLQILVERNELTNRHGRIAFSVLLLQDLAVVVVVPLVALLGKPDVGVMAAVGEAVGKAVVALLGILLAGRLVLRPLMRMVADSHSPELFTGLTLLLVLGISWLTELAGLSMALGAFLAGLLIAETEFRHQVEGDIAPFRGILLALFFMTVGMNIDLKLIVEHAVWVLALTLSLMVSKALILGLLCRLFGYPGGPSLKAGLALSQGGEFAFVLFTMATQYKLLSPDIAALVQVVVALSMALTPLAMTLGRHLAQRFQQPPPTASLEHLLEDAGDLRHHVLIAGFGRVGQTLARLIEANGLTYVALDLEPKRVAEGRARGVPVYYGDASRMEVLKAAGVAHARAAVVTLDHPHAAERAVRAIHQQWPRLPIFVRARDGTHRTDLERAGATMVVPEMIEGSLHLGSMLLRAIGRPPDQVSRLLKQFRDEAYVQLDDLIPARAPVPPPSSPPLPPHDDKGDWPGHGVLIDEADDPRR